MEDCRKIEDETSGVNQQLGEVTFEQSHEDNVNTMNHAGDLDGASVGQYDNDRRSPVPVEHGAHDTETMCMKEEETQQNVPEQSAWMEKSVKIRQNVVDMLEYVTFQLQNSNPDEAVGQLDGGMKEEADNGGMKEEDDNGGMKEEDDNGGVGDSQREVLPESVPFGGSEDQEILPDVGGSDSGLSLHRYVDVKAETLAQEEETETNKEVEISEPGGQTVQPGMLGDNMFVSSDVNMPPCVSQEEIIANCADGEAIETEVPLPFSGTFNNFKDAEVTVEMNEEDVEVLGAVSPAVKSQDYSEDDSDGSHNNMGYHREPLQQAMYHAMAPLPRNNGGDATVPYTSQAMSNIAYVRGIKREYPHDTQMQGPVRTKAARKITPPSPVKKEVNRDAPSASSSNRSLQENLRKQELDETFFTCDFCFKLFRRRNALMAHIKLHEALNIGNHNSQVYDCKQCKKSYSSRYNLNHHTKRCHGERGFKCGKCDEAYATQSDLSRHVRTHGVKSYKCNRCGKVFQKRKTFSAHTKVHPQVIYECITCFQKFSWEEELVEHNKTHLVPDAAPVTALTVKSEPLAPSVAPSPEPAVAETKAQGKHSNTLKLEYCYSYINRVKSEFANQPQAYQDFLNTIKQFKFKTIDINKFLEQIAYIFQDHQTLVDGFNIFLPDECKVEITSKTPKKQTVAVHDPLLDRQYNPRGELDDSLAYLGQVKARFSDKPSIYNTFTYIIKEYKLNSLQIPEVAARVTSLFKDHPDLILGFNTFLPTNNRISLPCYDSQLEGNDVKPHPTEPVRKQPPPEDSVNILASRQENTLTNGHAVDDKSAAVNNKMVAKSRGVDPSVLTEQAAIDATGVDPVIEIQESGASRNESPNDNAPESDKLNVAVGSFNEDIVTSEADPLANVVASSGEVVSQESVVVVMHDTPAGNVVRSPRAADYDTTPNDLEDSEVSSLTGIDTFTNIITVSPSDPASALPDIDKSVGSTNPKFPKVSVISGTHHKTTKYGGKGVAFTTVNVKPSAIPKSVDCGRAAERPSPTKIVPLKNSLLYQQLISQSNYRGHSNASLATFTKIDVNDRKKAFCSEVNSVTGDGSATKINSAPNVRNPAFKSGIKISVPYIVNSPNSNVIFTLANTMVDDSSKVDNAVGNNGTEANQNGKAVYAVPPASSSNVALISTNSLQNASSTNSYTGLNIVTSTNVAPSTYTLANTKSIASFPAAVPSGNGTNKQMLLIRTNPPSNTFFIANSAGRLMSGENALRPGSLVPITKTVPSNGEANVNTNEAPKMLALTTKTLATLGNNRVGKPTFLAGQKIAIVKTSVGDKTKGGKAPTLNNVAMEGVVSVSAGNRYITNAIDNASTSPKRRKLTNKKIDPVVKAQACRNRPLLPATSQGPFVVSFLPNVSENVAESDLSQSVRTYERSRPDETPSEQLGTNVQIARPKVSRKQCLVVKAADESKPPAVEHNGTLVSEICPKTYSRRDSLTKRAVETHSPDPIDLS